MHSIKSLAVGLLGIAAIGLAVVGVGSTAYAAPITTPTGLLAGDQYRLAFITSTFHDATSSDIAVYNKFVADLAATVPELAALGATWTAIASTPTVDARDNTSTLPTIAGGSPGAPIYLLNDTKFADDNDDLWGPALLINPLNITETGVGPIDNTSVWTGTKPLGQGFATFELGGIFNPILGLSFETNSPWITHKQINPISLLPLYAISSTITFGEGGRQDLPEPGTLILFSVGLAICAVARRRNRITGIS